MTEDTSTGRTVITVYAAQYQPRGEAGVWVDVAEAATPEDAQAHIRRNILRWQAEAFLSRVGGQSFSAACRPEYYRVVMRTRAEEVISTYADDMRSLATDIELTEL